MRSVPGGKDDDPPSTSPEMRTPTTPIQRWFGDDESAYLVLPRPLLEAMPPEWQSTFVTLVRQFQNAYFDVQQAPHYRIEAGEWIPVANLPQMCLEDLGITPSEPVTTDLGMLSPCETATLVDRKGLTFNTATEQLFIPRADPCLHLEASELNPHLPQGTTFTTQGSSPVSRTKLTPPDARDENPISLAQIHPLKKVPKPPALSSANAPHTYQGNHEDGGWFAVPEATNQAPEIPGAESNPSTPNATPEDTDNPPHHASAALSGEDFTRKGITEKKLQPPANKRRWFSRHRQTYPVAQVPSRLPGPAETSISIDHDSEHGADPAGQGSTRAFDPADSAYDNDIFPGIPPNGPIPQTSTTAELHDQSSGLASAAESLDSLPLALDAPISNTTAKRESEVRDPTMGSLTPPPDHLATVIPLRTKAKNPGLSDDPESA